MSDQEPKYIITGRVGFSSVVPGSDTSECSECHHAVWISPGSQKIMKEMDHKISLLCTECAKPYLKAAEKGDICPVHNGQLVELARYWKISLEEAAERVEAILKNLPKIID